MVRRAPLAVREGAGKERRRAGLEVGLEEVRIPVLPAQLKPGTSGED